MTVSRPAVPLLVWPELAEIDQLGAERDRLIVRIAQLRPHCHKRVELEYRLRLLTAQQLKLAARVGRIQ